MSRNQPTVHSDGQLIDPLPDGVLVRPITTHADHRGSLSELFDLRWNWHSAPLVSATLVTIDPGCIKGWAYHEVMEDRFALIAGKALFVFYDDRDDSSTKGKVIEYFVTENNRQLISVPTRLWHAVQCFGTKETVIVNFPTQAYQYDEPDKFSLPPDTDIIPYQFKRNCGH